MKNGGGGGDDGGTIVICTVPITCTNSSSVGGYSPITNPPQWLSPS